MLLMTIKSLDSKNVPIAEENSIENHNKLKHIIHQLHSGYFLNVSFLLRVLRSKKNCSASLNFYSRVYVKASKKTQQAGFALFSVHIYRQIQFDPENCIIQSINAKNTAVYRYAN